MHARGKPTAASRMRALQQDTSLGHAMVSSNVMVADGVLKAVGQLSIHRNDGTGLNRDFSAAMAETVRCLLAGNTSIFDALERARVSSCPDRAPLARHRQPTSFLLTSSFKQISNDTSWRRQPNVALQLQHWTGLPAQRWPLQP
jgi:hypothetical protein